ncbi:MAG: DUF1501 domain-containing protein [Pedosphaera sp.]|nr:DUF1501 domain-containing protein [Pedosphaera sp.]
MSHLNEYILHETRRQFLARGRNVLGYAALTALLGENLRLWGEDSPVKVTLPHFSPKVKQIIYLHMVGGPSQMDLFDYKPVMKEWYDKDLPDTIRMGQRLTTMTSGQKRFPVAPSKFKFSQVGKAGLWMNTELLPWTAKVIDDMAFIRSMHTEAINHEPAICHMQTGSMVGGRPCIGSWVSYGLGSLNENLPTFVVMVAEPTNKEQIQAISARLWSSGFVSGEHAGVPFRSQGDPILFINNPPGVTGELRRKQLDGLKALNELNYRQVGDPETHTRIQQFEMAYRMQTSVPELTAVSNEPESTYKLYGDEAKKPGTFAYICLLSRRLIERGVRFVQVYLNNWDHHSNVGGRLPMQCKDVDQATYGLIQDLKARGLFDSTLIIWGGEFGRTIYSQGGLTRDNYGRDHHPRCFTMWLAGGGIKAGTIHAYPVVTLTRNS